MYKIQEEDNLEAFKECLELGRLHYAEVEVKNDRIPYNYNFETIKALQSLGLLTVVTARGEDNSLLGYVAFFTGEDFQTSVVCARELGMFVKKEYRGTSLFYRMFKMAENCLKEKGVKAIYIMFKKGHDAGFAGRLGYELTETVYQKVV